MGEPEGGKGGISKNASCCDIKAFAWGDLGRSDRGGVALYVLSISIVR